MSTILTTTLRAAITGSLQSGALIGSGAFNLPGEPDVSLINGTGAGQADQMFSDQRTIAASGTDTLVLSAGTLKDQFGNAITLGHVKAILIKAAAGNTNNVVVGNAAAHPFVGPFNAGTDTVAIPPGGTLMLLAPVNGWAAVATTSDQLLMTNGSSGTSVTYDIVIVGTSS